IIAERRWFIGQKTKSHKDGSLTITFPYKGNKGIVKWILGWGKEVEVISPKELRTNIREYIESMHNIYHIAKEKDCE
ncbi:MAG: WYL domain-containing protein, partial [Desulfamplus sp.]|nr:WYL domain-containing protein [Desulfamplus sp.]